MIDRNWTETPHLEELWNIEEDGGKESWEDVGHDPHRGAVAHLERPVEDRSIS